MKDEHAASGESAQVVHASIQRVGLHADNACSMSARTEGTEQLSPAVEELLEGFETSKPESLSPRETRVEAVAGGTLVAASIGMPLMLATGRPLDVPLALALVGAYALLSRVRFPIGYGWTVPTQLVFVPMLLLLPAPAVPLLVLLASVLGNLPDAALRRSHPSRVLLAMGDSWHAVGPALVLAAFGPDEPTLSAWPVYVGALGAQFLFDLVASSIREWLGLGISPRLQPALFAWIWAVDALLSPVGLLAALVAVEAPVAALLPLPLAGLLVIFARERQSRLSQALELSRTYRGTTLLLSDVLESDDEYTGMHSRSVVSLSVAVADEMGLDARRRRNVEFGALLHDVGKMAIPNELINKPAPLTEDEWVVVKTHTLEGQRMLDRVGGVLSEIGRVVRSSHERWDGTGYPDGLSGEEIPLEATIVSCCDAFNAMTTDRPYRPARPQEQALAELRACAGTHFSPAVVAAVERIAERSLVAT